MSQAATTVALTPMETVFVAAVAALPHPAAARVAEMKSKRVIDKTNPQSLSLPLCCAAVSAIANATLILPAKVATPSGRDRATDFGAIWHREPPPPSAIPGPRSACRFTSNKDLARLNAAG
jgi:hypothetical protein